MTLRVAVIGAGILGLSAALHLARKGHEVIVFEKSGEPGGLAGSFKVNDTYLEKYHHFIAQDDEHLLGLARELNILDKIQWADTKLGYFIDNRLVPFTSPLDLMKFPLLGIIDKARFALAMRGLMKFKDYKELENIEARQWLIDNCGQKIYNVLWKQLMDLKFGKYVSDIPLSWLWARSTRRASSRRSLLSSTERFGYMQGSFFTLVKAILEQLDKLGVRLHMGEEIHQIDMENGTVKAVKSAGSGYEADYVISTVPLPVFTKMLELSEEYVSGLNKITYAAIVNVVVEVNRQGSDYFWLNISDTSVPFPGIIEFTNLRPPSESGGSHFLYIPNYAEPDSELLTMPKEEIERLYMPSLEKIYGSIEIKAFNLFRESNADPYYSLNYSQIMPNFETPVKRLFLCNTSQIYPATRSVNNSIKWGKVAAERVMK